MPFTLIKGTFHVRNYSPDGDSIRFQPDNAALLMKLPGGLPKFNARNHVQLRIEAIDALETHYNPASGGGTLHQPLKPAHLAADKLLDFVGITGVEWDKARRTVFAANDATRGYILTRSIEKYGRPVAFVFAGETPERDGSAIFLDIEQLTQSFNFIALANGYAYATFYEGLFSDLRRELSKAAATARKLKRGVYRTDKTSQGFDARSLKSITEEHAILPKLFRRLSEYMVNYGTSAGFKKQLEASREPVLDLRNCHFTHFDTFVEQEEGSIQIRLSRLPEELVFDPMPFRPANAFSAMMTNEPIITDLTAANVVE